MVCLCLFARSRVSQAAVVLYANEADFLSAAGALPMLLNDFTNFGYVGELVHPVQVSGGGISYSLSSEPPLDLYAFNGAISTDYTNDQIVASFTSGNITGAGGYFYSSDDFAAPITGTVTVSLSDGTTTNIDTPKGGPLAFVGFLSDGPIFTSLTVTNVSASGYPTLTHFYVVDGIPTLLLRLTETNAAVVSWYSAPPGFILQTAPRPDGPWTNVNTPPHLAGDYNQVTMPLTGPGGFFRLKK
jgi:hypothetical protein